MARSIIITAVFDCAMWVEVVFCLLGGFLWCLGCTMCAVMTSQVVEAEAESERRFKEAVDATFGEGEYQKNTGDSKAEKGEEREEVVLRRRSGYRRC